jgi:glucarate dehydratase
MSLKCSTQPSKRKGAKCDSVRLSILSNSGSRSIHRVSLAFTLATMLHLGAVIPNLSFAADAHYHHLIDDIIETGKFKYDDGSIAAPTGPGLGVKPDNDKLGAYRELYKRLGPYPYDQDPLIPGWTPTIPNDRWANPADRRTPHNIPVSFTNIRTE